MEFVEAVFYRKLTESDFKKMYKIEKPASGGGQTYIEATGIKDSDLSNFLSYAEKFENSDPDGRLSYRIHAYLLGKEPKTGENSENENFFLFFNPRHNRNYCITNQTPEKRHSAWNEINGFPFPKKDSNGNYISDVLDIVKNLIIIIIRTNYQKYYATFVDSEIMPESWGNVPLLNRLFSTDNDRRGIIFLPNETVTLIQDNKCPFKQLRDGEIQSSASEKLTNTVSYNNTCTQIIFYGVPGSGKSYTIKSILSEKSISFENTVRVVFHPEYTNSDFIGQILPKLKKDDNEGNLIDYKFTAGPFTKILREAYCNPTENYALIIEEINRGNAAAIFGELFQLLDRLDEDDTEIYNGVTYTKGWSSYGVHNDCINSFICGIYDEEGENKKEPCIHFDSNSAIRLPSNLSLFATMNTSDQNVFSLDNAFKRRWDLKLIPNKFIFDSDDTKENQKQLDQCFANIEEFGFTWGAFVNAINKKIISEQSGEDISSFEDKQIGMWFVKSISKERAGDKIITKETFLHKVIEYLFDDVFKLEPTQVFTKSSLAELIEIADENPTAIFASGIITAIESEQSILDTLKGNAKLG